MHLRNGTAAAMETTMTSERAALRMFLTSDEGHEEMNIVPAGSAYYCRGCSGTVTKKLLLWSILLLQVCFIVCFWLLELPFNLTDLTKTADGVNSNSDARRADVSVAGAVKNSSTTENNNNKSAQFYTNTGSVNFIRKSLSSSSSSSSATPMGQQIWQTKNLITLNDHLHYTNNFERDFIVIKETHRLNKTNAAETVADKLKIKQRSWCFREGTSNETGKTELKHCKCHAHWHGKDCGQPEVIWRALMTAKKQPFKVVLPHGGSNAHRLVVMLEGSFFSLDLLELQIKTIADIVDYFIIFVKSTVVKLKELERCLKDIRKAEAIKGVKTNFFIFHCNEQLRKTKNCTAKLGYKMFQRHLQTQKDKSGKRTLTFQSTDIFLYSTDHVLVSAKALKFLKYYATDVHLIRFRLKYIVYGFYWQHPKRTHLAGVLSSFLYLEQPHLGDCDPEQLQRLAASKESATFVIGDLNHYGGWYCEYCQQPDEIIAELQSDGKTSVRFPNDTRTHHIDVNYLQKLIANGIYVDGRTQLSKLRHYSDLHYAPSYAKEHSWKFGHLLVNLYESLDEESEGEGNY